MPNRPMANSECFAQRWVACFDWLGFSSFINSHATAKDADKRWIEPFIRYATILDCIKPDDNYVKVKTAWFSDTYIFYTDDNSYESYGKLKVFATDFIDCALKHDIPMCGAMACGDLYADEDNNLFFGKALIESYSYAENQDWVGFILCPSAIERIENIKREIGATAELYDIHNFKNWEVPLKKDCDKNDRPLKKDLLTYRLGRALGGHATHATREVSISILKRLMSEAIKDGQKAKYQKTIDFLQKTYTTSK